MPVGGLGELKLRLKFVDIDRAMKDLERSFRPLVEKIFGGLRFDTRAGEGAVSGVMKILGVAIAINYGIQSIANILQRVSPLLESMLDLFSQAISLILKPIGDFVAILLRPFILFFFRYVTLPLLQFLTKGYPTISKMADTLDKILNSLPKEAKMALGGAMAGASIGFMLGGPAGALIGAGIGALIGFLASLDWKGIIEKIKGFIAGIFNFFKSVWEMFLDIGKSIVNLFTGIGKWLFDLIVGIILTELDILRGLGSWIWEGIKGIINFGGAVWDNLRNFGKWLWDNITKILAFGSEIWNNLANFGKWLFEKIKETILGGLNILADLGSKIYNWIWDKIKGIGGAVWSFITGGRERVGDFIITKGKVIETNPEDIIFGVKRENLGRLGNLNITVNVNVDRISSEIDIENMARVVSERLASDLYRYSRW